MNRSAKTLLAALMLLVGVALGGGAVYWSLAKQAAPTTQPAQETQQLKQLWTCGMHPEVIEEEPGDCLKCGMKLTPMDPDRAQVILEARGEVVPEAAPQERKILYWRAPMDPSYIRNEPGKSPMGMDLVPVYSDQVQAGPTANTRFVTVRVIDRQGSLGERTVNLTTLIRQW